MQILGYDPFIPDDFREDELKICDLEYLIKNLIAKYIAYTFNK